MLPTAPYRNTRPVGRKQWYHTHDNKSTVDILGCFLWQYTAGNDPCISTDFNSIILATGYNFHMSNSARFFFLLAFFLSPVFAIAASSVDSTTPPPPPPPPHQQTVSGSAPQVHLPPTPPPQVKFDYSRTSATSPNARPGTEAGSMGSGSDANGQISLYTLLGLGAFLLLGLGALILSKKK